MDKKDENQHRSELGRTAEMSFTIDKPKKTDWLLYFFDMLTVVTPVALTVILAGASKLVVVLTTLGAIGSHGRGFWRNAEGRHRQSRTKR